MKMTIEQKLEQIKKLIPVLKEYYEEEELHKMRQALTMIKLNCLTNELKKEKKRMRQFEILKVLFGEEK